MRDDRDGVIGGARIGDREVIKTPQWGLVPLGHRAGVAENEFASGSNNVVLGFQMLAEAMLDTLPPAASRSLATSLSGGTSESAAK